MAIAAAALLGGSEGGVGGSSRGALDGGHDRGRSRGVPLGVKEGSMALLYGVDLCHTFYLATVPLLI